MTICEGPITRERLHIFALATTFRRPMWSKPNLQTVHCKICGVSVAKKKGNTILIVNTRSEYQSPCFLCDECFALVTAAIDEDGRFPPPKPIEAEVKP